MSTKLKIIVLFFIIGIILFSVFYKKTSNKKNESKDLKQEILKHNTKIDNPLVVKNNLGEFEKIKFNSLINSEKNFDVTNNELSLKRNITNDNGLFSVSFIGWVDEYAYFTDEIYPEGYLIGILKIDYLNKIILYYPLSGYMVRTPVNILRNFVVLDNWPLSGYVEASDILDMKLNWTETNKNYELKIYDFINKKESTILSYKGLPDKRVNFKWLSDVTLQYITPEGETKIFTIPNE